MRKEVYILDEIRVFIVNLGKYNEGESIGDWFTLPVDEEEVAERIGLNDEYEEFAIHDYEAPFKVDEYMSLDDLNHLAELAEEIDGTPLGDAAREVQQAFFNSFEEMVESKDDIICYSDCSDMTDVAAYFIEELGSLGEMSPNIQRYIDYEAFGRDLEIEGNFVCTSYGVFEYIG